MEAGFPEYGCAIQVGKTFKNFVSRRFESSTGPALTDGPMPSSSSVSSPPLPSTELVFFGTLINSSTMTCRPDFSAHFGRNIAYATTLSCDAVDTEGITKFV